MTKNFSHKVSMQQQRREQKAFTDLSKKGVSDKALKHVFNNYYRDQVQALYRAITRNR